MDVIRGVFVSNFMLKESRDFVFWRFQKKSEVIFVCLPPLKIHF